MIETAVVATDMEVQAAARYYSALRPKASMTVVESNSVPKTHIAGMFLATQPAGGTEPIGRRIIEVPVDVDQFLNGDSRAKFIAYAPVGSLAIGELLANTGRGGHTVGCATCHGLGFKGMGDFPRIAGRSPSYLFRQLYDIKFGARKGSGSAAMLPTVANLTEDDMLSLAAYLASLPP